VICSHFDLLIVIAMRFFIYICVSVVTSCPHKKAKLGYGKKEIAKFAKSNDIINMSITCNN